jgi:hypothetical protein
VGGGDEWCEKWCEEGCGVKRVEERWRELRSKMRRKER